MSEAPREREFQINGITLRAVEWGNPADSPVIALHGWLDNAASFSRLVPELKSVHVIALDMAGHGRSDHRPGVGAYTFWDDIQDVIVLADLLGWQSFTLMGHSRGAIIAAIAAACFPQRINRLVLIEGVSSDPVAVDDAPVQMADALTSLIAMSRKTKPRTRYPSFDAAVTARMNGMFVLSEVAARFLAERGVIKSSEGYSWSSDPRLLAPSPLKLTREHIAAFLSKISVPTHLILASYGLPKLYPSLLAVLKNFPNLPYVILEGGHHLHLEKEYDVVADEINQFFYKTADKM